MSSEFSNWPAFSKQEADIVSRVLLSNKVNYWTGELGREFEEKFARYVGTEHAIAVANGTLALDLALRALGVGEGDEVIVTPRTFIASASAITLLGAKPVFADIDRESQNITAGTIASVLSKKTKAIICVHLAGFPCDMQPIMELAKSRGVFVIEDCAQAHGAHYRGRSVGSFGHIGAWSFCQDKIMTTGGEGGMVTTDEKHLWAKMWSYKDHGKSWEMVHRKNHPPGFRWLHESFGSNYRLTEMQSALGIFQLGRVDEWVNKRRKNAKMINRAVEKLGSVRIPSVPDYIYHSFYKNYLFVRPDSLKFGWDRNRIMNEISTSGVPCYSGSCSEVYCEKAFSGSNSRPDKRLPVAAELGENSLMFVVHPNLTPEEVRFSCSVIQKVLSAASI